MLVFLAMVGYLPFLRPQAAAALGAGSLLPGCDAAPYPDPECVDCQPGRAVGGCLAEVSNPENVARQRRRHPDIDRVLARFPFRNGWPASGTQSIPPTPPAWRSGVRDCRWCGRTPGWEWVPSECPKSSLTIIPTREPVNGGASSGCICTITCFSLQPSEAFPAPLPGCGSSSVWGETHWRGFRRARFPSLEKSIHAGGFLSLLGLFLAGLFEFNFGDSEVLMVFLFLVSAPYALGPTPGFGLGVRATVQYGGDH